MVKWTNVKTKFKNWIYRITHIYDYKTYISTFKIIRKDIEDTSEILKQYDKSSVIKKSNKREFEIQRIKAIQNLENME